MCKPILCPYCDEEIDVPDWPIEPVRCPHCYCEIEVEDEGEANL